jgi:hypothetical protein
MLAQPATSSMRILAVYIIDLVSLARRSGIGVLLDTLTGARDLATSLHVESVAYDMITNEIAVNQGSNTPTQQDDIPTTPEAAYPYERIDMKSSSDFGIERDDDEKNTAEGEAEENIREPIPYGFAKVLDKKCFELPGTTYSYRISIVEALHGIVRDLMADKRE